MLARAESNRFIAALKRSFWLLSSLGGLIFLGCGAYLGWQELWKNSWSIDYRHLLSSLPVYWIALASAAINWNWIMRSLGANVGFRRNMKLYCFTNASKQLPTIIWFIGTRVFVYEREGVPKSLTSVGILLELTLLTFANIVVCLLILPIFPALHLPQRWVPLVLFVPLLVIMLRPRILIRVTNFFLARFGHAALTISIRWQDMLLWSALYSLTWGLGGVFLYLVVMAVYPGAALYPVQVIGAWALSGLVSRLRLILPIGIGWSQVSQAYLLSFFMPLPAAVIVTLLSWFWLALNEAASFLISLVL